MAAPRDPAVTEYVRMRMRERIDSKRHGTQKQIAARIGISESGLSQLWQTGVAARSIDGYARELGFPDADALRATAYEWYRERSMGVGARKQEPAVLEALEAVKKLYPLLTDQQWDMILARFGHPDFAGRDASYWLVALGQEVAQDMRRAQLAAAGHEQQTKERRWNESRERAQIRDAFREAARHKKKLAPSPNEEATRPDEVAVSSGKARAR